MNTNNGGPLSFEAILNDEKFNSTLDSMAAKQNSFSQSIVAESLKWDSTFKKLGAGIAAAFTFQKAEQFITDVVRVRGEFQQLDIAFTSMLQSKEKSDALMSQLVRTAQTTPFSLTDVAQGAKQLIAYGTSADQVNDTLIRLGNVASGLSVPINDLVYLYGTLQSQGRAYAQDIRQFAGRGIPIYEELAKVLGVSKDKVNDLVSAGKVGFPEVQKVFQNLTNEGGMFYNLMEKQSKSLSGQVSNLGDAWDQMLNKIGSSNEGILSDGISVASDLVEHYEEIGKILAILIATYGSYKAAMIAVSTVQSVIASSSVASVYLEMAAGLGTLTTAEYANAIAIAIQTKAQQALNLVLAASPYIFIAAAVGTIVAAYFAWTDSSNVVANAQKAVNDQMERFAQINDDLKSKVSKLTAIVNDSNATTMQQVVAYDELQRLLPQVYGSLSLHQAQTLSAADAQKKLNQVIDQNNIANLTKAYDDQKNKLEEMLSSYTSLGKLKLQVSDIDKDSPNALITQKLILDDLAEKIREQQRLKEQAAEQDKIDALPLQQKVAYYQRIKDEINIQIEAIRKSQSATNGVAGAVDLLTGKVHNVGGAFGILQGVINGIDLSNLSTRLTDIQNILKGLTGSGPVLKNKAFYTDQQKKAQDALDLLPDKNQTDAQATEWKKQAALIKDAEDHLDAYALKVKKLKKEDIVLPAGSVAEYDRLLKKANEAIQQTPTGQLQRVKDLQATILDLTQKRADAQKVIEVRTWQETLDYKEKQYQEYESVINAAKGFLTDQISLIAAEQAPNVYKDLLAGGQTYYQFLKNQLDPLNNKVLAGTATADDLAKVMQITSKLNELDGRPSLFDQWSKDLEKTKDEAGGTSAYLDILHSKLDALNATPIDLRTNLQRQEIKKLNDEIEDTSNAQSSALKAFLQQQEGSAAQIDAIKQKYKDLREEVARQGGNTDGIDNAQTKELADIAYKSSQAFKDMDKAIFGDGIDAIDQYIERLKKLRDEAVKDYGETSDEVKKIDNETMQANDQRTQKMVENWTSIASSVEEVGSALQGMTGVLGAVGSLLAGAASESNKFSKNIELAKKNVALISSGKGANVDDSIAAAVQGISDLSSILLNSIEKKKADKNSRALDAINFQVELNKALNQELLLRSQLADNVYFKDYAGGIQDSISAATDALTKYNLAIANLMENGKSLTGTKNTIDWGNVGKGALSGLGAGAVVGSVFGPVGTVIGAAVGALVGGITGLFSSKTKNLYVPLLQQYPQLIDANGELNKSLAETLISTNQVDDKTKLWLQDLINASDEMEAAKKQIDDIVSELSGDLGNDLRDALVGAFEDGTDAATAFSNSVEKTLNNVLSNLIFSAVFKNLFDNLQKELEDGLLVYGTTGQLGNVMDAFDDFINGSKGDIDLFNQLLQAAKDKGALSGLDLFSPDDSSANGGSAAQGISRSITEDTADVISGQINAMRINQAAALNIFKTHTTQFDMMIHYQSYLVRIDQKLAAAAQTPWRALGLGEDPEH